MFMVRFVSIGAFGQFEEGGSVVATRIGHLCVLIVDLNGDSMGKRNAESPKKCHFTSQ